MSVLTKFCKDLNPRRLDRLSASKQKELIMAVDAIHPHKIPEDKRCIWYIIMGYFKPTTLYTLYPHEMTHLNLQNFCSFFIKHNFNELRERLNYTTYSLVARKGIEPRLKNLSTADLRDIFEIIDFVWFHGLLQRLPHTTLSFRLSKAWKKVAGTCTKRGCHYTISLAPNLHMKPFKTMYRQNAGGKDLYCYNPLDCLLNTFYHELVHLIIFVLCPQYNVPGGHSNEFKKIMNNLFGHTDFRHGFGKDPDKVGKWTKSSLATQKINYIYIDHPNTKQKTKVKIIALNPRKARIRIPDTGKIWNFPYALVHNDLPDQKHVPITLSSDIGKWDKLSLQQAGIGKGNIVTARFEGNHALKVRITKLNPRTASGVIVWGEDNYSRPVKILYGSIYNKIPKQTK
jgi:hypothetical protein